MCNCEFCIKCDTCGHKADEHLAGEGPCHLCNCAEHKSKIVDYWIALTEDERQETSFQEFADSFPV